MGFGLKIGLLAAVALLLGHHAYANPCPPGNPPTNCAPPPGAILDLAGTAIPHGAYQQYHDRLHSGEHDNHHKHRFP